MKVRILESASQDLLNGFHFYECQDKGLGVYFLDTLFSDIDSLIVYAGIHPVYFNRSIKWQAIIIIFAVFTTIRLMYLHYITTVHYEI